MKIRSLISILLLLVVLALPAFADDLSQDTVKKCKRAVVLVRNGDESEGTAFSIGQGLFITNAHVVEGADNATQIKLVLNSGEANQRIVSATILKSDEEADLAVLKCDDPNLPPGIDLGYSTDLVETTPVTSFGFPFGSDLAVGKNDYPNISVSIGHITALRREEGKILRIQLDASLNPGNSGGPVINNAGQVIGVVQSGIPGASLNFAIPVDNLRKMLYGSLISVRAPTLNMAFGAASNFVIGNIPLPKNTSNVTVALRLNGTGEDVREYKAAADGNGGYTVSATLIAVPAYSVLRMDVDLPDGSFSYTIKDKKVMVMGRAMNLSSLKGINFGPRPSAVLQTGQTVTGSITDLSPVEILSKGKFVPKDLKGATRMTFSQIPPDAKGVAYELLVKNGAELLASQKGRIVAAGVFPDIVPAAKKKTADTDSAPAEAAPAGGGLVADDYLRNPSNGHWYCAIVLDQTVTWLEAFRLAASMRYKGVKGHLVTITSAEENYFVATHFPGDAKNSFWLGGYHDKSGGWKWVTGEPMSFLDWGPGEPNGGGAAEFMNMFPGGHWNDTSNADDHGFGFIVEFDTK
jgi:V8-like Glu-specific endopeptidase